MIPCRLELWDLETFNLSCYRLRAVLFTHAVISDSQVFNHNIFCSWIFCIFYLVIHTMYMAVRPDLTEVHVHVFEKSLRKLKLRRYQVAVFYCWALQNNIAVSSHGSCVPGPRWHFLLATLCHCLLSLVLCLALEALQLLTAIDSFSFPRSLIPPQRL